MDIKTLVEAAHQNAVSKGWWEEERTYGELIALVHSEVSEALEDFRNGKQPNEVWYEGEHEGQKVRSYIKDGKCQKLCGVPSELADICIRIFDIAGKYGWRNELALKYAVIPIFDNFERVSIAENLAWIHHELAESFVSLKRWKDGTKAVVHLANAIAEVVEISQMFDIDIDRAIAEKMAYNATRPQRHGGKVL